MLFTSAGGLSAAADHLKSLHDLLGTFYINKWAGLGFVAGACSMMGIPGFAGFASKISLTMASFDSPLIIWSLAALALSSVLNALYYVPAMIAILTGTDEKIHGVHEKIIIPLSFKISIGMFIALNFYLGLRFVPLLRLIMRGVNIFG